MLCLASYVGSQRALIKADEYLSSRMRGEKQ